MRLGSGTADGGLHYKMEYAEESYDGLEIRILMDRVDLWSGSLQNHLVESLINPCCLTLYTPDVQP